MLAFLHTPRRRLLEAGGRPAARGLRRRSQVRLGGGAIASRQVTAAIQRDLRRAELIAFPLVLLLSFWVFRGFVAAFLPPLVGAGAIALTFLGLRIAVEVHPLSVFALNLVTGLGLGLAIDYSLFIVSRWREEAARHGHGPEALAATMRSAGRTVVFSALTVAASMACLLVFPQQFLYSMGLGGVLVALSAGLRRARSAAGVPLLARPADRRARAAAPAAAALGRPLGAARRVGDAAAGPGRGRVGVRADRARDPRPPRALRRASTRRRCPSSASSRQVAEALDREGIRGRYAPDHRDHGTRRLEQRSSPARRRSPAPAAVLPARRDCPRSLAARSPATRRRARRTARSSSSARCAPELPEAASPGRRRRSSISRRRSPRTCRGRSRFSR